MDGAGQEIGGRTSEQVLANAQLVLPDEVRRGHLVLRDGRIAEIGSGAVPRGALDCEGDYLIPGLVELHTDNLERHLMPRPKAHWPHNAAIVAHDAELCGCGITTVFDAIRVGSIVEGPRGDYRRYARPMADEILAMRRQGALRIDHKLHLRAETCSETLIEELSEFGPEDGIGIVSLMDHTPGQRQFSDISKFEDYVCGKHGLSRAGFEDYIQFLYDLHDQLGARHEAAAVEAAGRFGAVLASHDDTTRAQVMTSHAYGIRVAEFPTTVEAARACHETGIRVIMGAPNLVRGGSHSGNVSALELADLGLLDILSSDYVPAALLQAAVQLGQHWGDMARGIATVSAAPADAAGLSDRGRIGAGLRADLVRFSLRGGVPVTRGIWVEGERVG
ncbi:alpha-D-ribose 1-methylphosphonate 5-triphosphate diphosphatase [Pseudooceanicola sp. CBS1P-1]|uniref:Alpha-D-ribose 1-methylphosphonate 5-triphosphate diphosphatase n=1 Tax=Pseudooceanicola albus TaxID=2692189 RepID=A0A6L7G0I9_9RHOB|nr:MULTISPECIES: alpha-D-ribose 1-methylphosphonate 5-triphosphate diphosphatase [Pseudooceanicola]MBT9382345.1 alpha-D-ribose 1-methylphosphonate 5-triphosphate diphosphatase [Pseudooceanicola endophyticus]MXN16887.1 alpha-D-ribose 1-methylphosphonate 5-triphosphate diphosphatase [Pseudooceanicola albus]